MSPFQHRPLPGHRPSPTPALQAPTLSDPSALPSIRHCLAKQAERITFVLIGRMDSLCSAKQDRTEGLCSVFFGRTESQCQEGEEMGTAPKRKGAGKGEEDEEGKK